MRNYIYIHRFILTFCFFICYDSFHLYVATFQQHLHMEHRVYISQLIRYSRACGS